MMSPRLRRDLANALALLGAVAVIAAVVAGIDSSWLASALLAVITVAAWAGAFHFNRPRRSRIGPKGHLILFETPFVGVTTSRTPALTLRGARDSIEAFISIKEFETLFGGWALWAPPRHPVPEMPDEALGVWSRRTCGRLRRVLRERGATVEVRREPGPEQRIDRLVRRRR